MNQVGRRFLECLGLLYTLSSLASAAATDDVRRQRQAPARKSLGGSSKVSFSDAYGKLPLSFEANQGQNDRQIKFLSRGRGYTLFLTSSEVVLALRKPQVSEKLAGSDRFIKKKRNDGVLRIKLMRATPHPQVTGLEELPGKVNYFIGNNPEKWRTNIPTYAKVKHEDVYPGIDVVYYGNQRQLEYDFVVAPGADPKVIQLEFRGADKIELDAEGDLTLHTGGGQIQLQKPLVYQEADGARQEISAGYVIKGEYGVHFEVGNYDAARPLVIDPVLTYSTYLGGASDDFANGIALDAAGNAYVTGYVDSSNFPTAHPFQPANGGFIDVFVAKLNADGSALLYSTYLGGSRFDEGSGIAVDAAGNAYVTGNTSSTNFPTENPLQPALDGVSDAFVAKLNASGSALFYSTYLGGSGGELGRSIAVDSAGNAYVTGGTSSTNFPTENPLQPALDGTIDAFVAKLNADGSTLVYSTYLGGRNVDGGLGIAVDHTGNAYVTGETRSANFPTAHPMQPSFGGGFRDAFVTKLNAQGSILLYSTYLGGRGSFEEAHGIAVNSSGNAYVTGGTDSTDFPTAHPLQPALDGTSDAFVAQFSADGSALRYSTYLGGGNRESGNSVAVDAAGNAYVTGDTRSTNFPTLHPLQPALGGFSDAFVTQLNPDGSALIYSTYLGGSDFDGGRGIAVDHAGNAYVAGSAGPDFPTTPGAFQTIFGGLDCDAFVAKIGEVDDMAPSVSCSVALSLLWPPNRALNNVGFGVTVTDESDPSPIMQVSVFGNDAADSSDAAEIAPDTLRLRAERTENGARVYLIVVTAIDRAGNVGLDVCTVVVPHNQSRAAIASVNAEAAAAAAFYRASQTAPPGYHLLGDGP